MLSVLTAHAQNRHKETLDSVGYDHYLDCGDGIMDIWSCPNSLNCTEKLCAVLCISIIPQ